MAGQALINQRRSAVKFLYVVLITILLVGCGSSAEQMTSTAVIAQAQTQIAAPTLTPTETHTPTVLPSPSPTPTHTATPKSTTGLVSGHAFWEKTNAPVAGIQLNFGGTVTLGAGQGIITDAQGNYSAMVNAGSFSFTIQWQFAGLSDVPCSSLAFTLPSEWGLPLLLNLKPGGYMFTAFSPKLSVEAGEEVKQDIEFICQ